MICTLTKAMLNEHLTFTYSARKMVCSLYCTLAMNVSIRPSNADNA